MDPTFAEGDNVFCYEPMLGRIRILYEAKVPTVLLISHWTVGPTVLPFAHNSVLPTLVLVLLLYYPILP